MALRYCNQLGALSLSRVGHGFVHWPVCGWENSSTGQRSESALCYSHHTATRCLCSFYPQTVNQMILLIPHDTKYEQTLPTPGECYKNRVHPHIDWNLPSQWHWSWSLGLHNPATCCESEYTGSRTISEPFVKLIVTQDEYRYQCQADQLTVKSTVYQQRHE